MSHPRLLPKSPGPRLLSRSRGSSVGSASPVLVSLPRARGAGRGAPGPGIVCPGAARQAASPWDNFQGLHTDRDKVQSGERKKPGLFAPSQHPRFLLLSPGLLSSAPCQPQETLPWSRRLPKPARCWRGLSSPLSLPGHRPLSPSPGHAGQGWTAAVAPLGQWSPGQESWPYWAA